MIVRVLLASVFAALPLAAQAADLGTDYSFIEDSLAPGPTHVGPTVLLEGYGGYNWIDTNDSTEDEKTEFWLYGGWAAINIPVRGASGIQLEMFGEGTSVSSDENDNYNWSAGGGVHAFWRDPSRGLLGVFGGAVYSDVGNADNDHFNHAWAWLAGIEGQAYLNMTTLYGQAGYATYVDSASDGSGSDPDFPKDVIFVRGVARHFLTDHTKLEGEVGGAFGEFDTNDDGFFIVNWALEAEHAIANASPVSIFARYEGIYAHQDEDAEYSLDSTIKVGLRGRFGGAAESAYFNDRNGVSLEMPDVGRWGGVLNGPIE